MKDIEEKLIELGLKKNFVGQRCEFWVYTINDTYHISYTKNSGRISLSLRGYGVIKTFYDMSIQELESLIHLFSK